MFDESKIIPVVFSTDDGYMPYLGVTIFSLMENASADWEYRLYILYTSLSLKNQKRLKDLARDNISIECIDITKNMEGVTVSQVSHLTVESAYRLFIPELFPQYEKIIYLDCDIVILKNVADLYQIEIGNNILGAALGRIFNNFENYLTDDLNIPISKFFNAGILIINCKRFKEENIKEKSLALLMSGKTYLFMDQDALNISCCGKVEYIDGRWNFEWGHLVFESEPVIDESRKGTLEMVSDPYIIHYVSIIKPWSHPNELLAHYFWDYARKTNFYEEIVLKNTLKNIEKKKNWFDEFSFPFDQLTGGCEIVLFGAGNLGNVFYNQISITQYCNIVLWCDNNYKKYKENKIKISNPNEISSVEYDYIVIAIVDEDVAMDVKKSLVSQGVIEDKIIWQQQF